MMNLLNLKTWLMTVTLWATLSGTVAHAGHEAVEKTKKSSVSKYDAGQPVGFAASDRLVTGGAGGDTVVVTSVDALKKALTAEGSSIILVRGEISFDSRLSIRAKNKTLLGMTGSLLTNPNRTKEGSGILYFKEGSENLILRNLTFESAGAYDTDGSDNLCIDGTRYIWVDHCDFRDAVDGNFDCKNASDFIAVTWCRFRYQKAPLAGGPGGSDDHRFSSLWGSSDKAEQDRGHLRTTFQYCWWDEGCRERMPRIRFGQVHLVNCLYASSVTHTAIGLGKEADVLVESSVFDGIKKPFDDKSNHTGRIRFDDCFFRGGKEPFGTGHAFTPTYTLPTRLHVDKVEKEVTRYAGATLLIGD